MAHENIMNEIQKKIIITKSVIFLHSKSFEFIHSCVKTSNFYL